MFWEGKDDSMEGGRDTFASSEGRPPKTKVLVVDDEATLRQLLTEVLTEDGYEVASCSAGSEALERLGSHGESFDIVVTDLKLPGANGLEVLREARARDPDCVVIIMTGYATVESAVECMKAGAMDYVTKPLKLDELRLMVKRAAERLFLLAEAQKKRYYEELSRVDELTGVFNRRRFRQLLLVEIERAKRGNRSLPLLMIDIDNFKRVNDTHGHGVGDHVLRELGRLLTAEMRRNDHVARYGGEEFTVILTETGREGALAVAERIRKAVEEQDFEPEGLEEAIRLTVSIGMAVYPEDAEEEMELMVKADHALYAAKAAGKNCVRAFVE
jgi:diguanylate cyclase (GGDEF)-like protein